MRLVFLASMTLIVALTYGALLKMRDHTIILSVLETTFRENDWTEFISWVLPLTELLIVVLLLFPKTMFVGFVGAGVVLACYTCYIALILFGSIDVPCSCIAMFSQWNWKLNLIVNIILIVAAFFAALRTFPDDGFKDFMRINRNRRTPV